VDGKPVLTATLPFPNLAVLPWSAASGSGSDGGAGAVLTGLPEGGARLPVACASEGVACRIASVALYNEVPPPPLPVGSGVGKAKV
jgi:hypothetical protein